MPSESGPTEKSWKSRERWRDEAQRREGGRPIPDQGRRRAGQGKGQRDVHEPDHGANGVLRGACRQRKAAPEAARPGGPQAPLSPMLSIISYIVLLSSVLANAEVGRGTVFWVNGDPGNPNPENACYRRAPGIPRYLQDEAMAFASRTMRCGQQALIINPRTNRSVLARRWDWGPQGGLIDLTKGVAKKLRHNGKELVVVIPLP